MNLIWIFSSVETNGTAAFRGKEISGQIGHNYTVVSFVLDDKIVMFNTSDNIFFEPGTPLRIRYNRANPADARLATAAGLWAGTFFYSAIPLLIIFIIFLHPDLIPYRSCIRVSERYPFLFLA